MPRRAQTSLSFLDAPLDEVLGQVSHVRLLRVLSESPHPLPPGELARATQLNLSGVVRAIERLTALGIISSLGVGGRRVVELNGTHDLTAVLRTLFEAERQRRPMLIAALQEALASVAPPPRSAWIEGPHARGEDAVQDALRIGVLSTVRERHAVAEQLTPRLREIERQYDLSIELLVRTRADLETLSTTRLEDVRQGLLLFGVPALPELASSTNARQAKNVRMTHADLDRQSRSNAEALARAVARDPRLIDGAQRWVQHRLQRASAGEAHELREWEHILTMPAHRISAFLRDPGERATRLRQTNPFVSVRQSRLSGERR